MYASHIHVYTYINLHLKSMKLLKVALCIRMYMCLFLPLCVENVYASHIHVHTFAPEVYEIDKGSFMYTYIHCTYAYSYLFVWRMCMLLTYMYMYMYMYMYIFATKVYEIDKYSFMHTYMYMCLFLPLSCAGTGQDGGRVGASSNGDRAVQGDWHLHHEERGGDGTDAGRPHCDGASNVILAIQETI